MYVIRVTDHDLASEFIHLPARLNQQHRLWSKSQQKHAKVLINRKSPFFKQGEAEFWILNNFRGETIGRVAAFVEHSISSLEKKGFIGLFECINHFKAASLLFDTCRDWLKQFEVEMMEGPVSFLPFQIEGVAMEAEFRQPTPFFQSQTNYLTQLYENYGFRICKSEQLLNVPSVSSLLNEQKRMQAEKMFAESEYAFLKIKKTDDELIAEDIHKVYKSVRQGSTPIPSVADIVQWLRLLFEQHFPPLIWIAYHQKTPVAFIVNAFISAKPGQVQNETVFQQLVARFSNKNQSLLNLSLLVHPDYQSSSIPAALLSKLEEALAEQTSPSYESFLLMNTGLEHFIKPSTSDLVDTFVKFEYQFDQEMLNSTFADSKSFSRD